MANPEHLAILKQGAEAWNEWRETTSEPPDLSREDLERYDDLRKYDFRSANLNNCYLSFANLVSSNLSEADLTGANLGSANLSGANLSLADLRGAYLRSADLSRAYLKSANLSQAIIHEGLLQDTNLNQAILKNTEFFSSNLTRANLSESDLSETGFNNATLFFTNLTGALISKSDFTGALLSYASFGDVDLSTAIGLDTVEHISPSTVGIDTIYRSGGQIAEAFLRGTGLPETFITYARSLLGKAIDFYSCFISYSSKDQDFATRLHADLQSKGVRVWFAPEDLKIGDKFRMSIDEAIRVYDKLLIVLSGNSIKSTWVEKEVETAFDRETRDKRIVLFPIRLDNAVMKTEQPWAADLRRTRHIGDFTGWKVHDK